MLEKVINMPAFFFSVLEMTAESIMEVHGSLSPCRAGINIIAW
jgi:hypothetical protein